MADRVTLAMLGPEIDCREASAHRTKANRRREKQQRYSREEWYRGLRLGISVDLADVVHELFVDIPLARQDAITLRPKLSNRVNRR